jgi:RNA recognition motif-containing protein
MIRLPVLSSHPESAAPAVVPESGDGARWARTGRQREDIISSRIFVGNLSYETSQADLETLFATVGPVTEVFLPIDRATDRPRGFAFVEFGDSATVTAAIEKLDGSELNGRNLRVSEARDRAPRPQGGGFMDDGPPAMDFGRRPAKPKGSRRGLRGRKRGF